MHLIKFKTFPCEIPIKGGKASYRMGEKVFHHLSDKGHLSKMYKSFLNLNSKLTYPIRKSATDLDILRKRTYKNWAKWHR